MKGVYEGYWVISIGVLIGMYHLNFDTYGSSVQSVTCILFAVVLVVIPCLVISDASGNFLELGSRRMKQRYGSFFTDLRLKSGKAVLMEPAFFMFRRLVMAFAIVVCRDILIVQVYLIWAQSTVAVTIIGFAKPYETRK